MTKQNKDNISNTKPFVLPFHVQKKTFFQKLHFSQNLTVLEQNGQCHKKCNSKVGLKANEKGSSTKTLLIETQKCSRISS